MPCAHPTLLGSAAHGDTGTHVAAQAGGSSCADAPVLWCFADKTMGVFHLQSPRRKYDFTYEQAQAACAAEGASLATFQQLGAAQQVRAGVALSPHGAGTRHAPPGARASPGGHMWVGADLPSARPCLLHPDPSNRRAGWSCQYSGMGLVTVPSTLGVGGMLDEAQWECSLG